eukprot:scaffold199465_cov46-Tisochrysis_lutea.AAC.1
MQKLRLKQMQMRNTQYECWYIVQQRCGQIRSWQAALHTSFRFQTPSRCTPNIQSASHSSRGLFEVEAILGVELSSHNIVSLHLVLVDC